MPCLSILSDTSPAPCLLHSEELASYLFLTLHNHASASGPLHQLFPLPRDTPHSVPA